MSGWISLHRKILEHWIYTDKPFDRRSAWNDLIFLANFIDNKCIFNKQAMIVKRGSFITSECKLSERWGWTRKKVRAFLELLISDNMISKKSTARYTHITITNYNLYQFERIRVETVETVVGTTDGTTETIDIKRFESCKGTTDGTQVEQLFEAHRGTTDGTTETIDIKRFESCKGTTEELGRGGASGTQYNNIDLVTLYNNNNHPPTRKVDKLANVMEGEEALGKIFKVAELGNYPEPTELFMRGVIRGMWEDRTMPLAMKVGLTHEEIRDCLRNIKPEHIGTALRDLEKCKHNKKIYFANALKSAITERAIEVMHDEEGELNDE